MKKVWGILFTLFGILGFIQSVTVVKAAGEYEIEQYHAKANVLKNGDADLTQRVTYRFDGDFHGVYYNQDIKGIKGMTDPQVSVEKAGQITSLTQAESGQNDTYKISKTANNVNIKVYHNVSDETVTYVYRYRLNGLITNYLDTAELNWKMIGSGWDNDLNNVKLTVQLPADNVTQLQAWTHGPLDGHTEVNRKKGQVVMTLDDNLANQFVESHIIFPTAVTADNPNVVNKKAKARIQADEKELVLEANAGRQRKKGIYYGFLGVGALIIIIMYLYKFISVKRHPYNKHVIPTPLYHVFDEPKFIPSMTKIILNHTDKADNLSLSADLLNEVGRRRMKIEPVGRTFEITALVPPTNSFFKYLIEKVGNGKKVTLKQIKSAAKSLRYKNKLIRRFDKWADEAAQGRDKYLDISNINSLNDFKVMAIVTSITAGLLFLISVAFGKNILISLAIEAVVILAAWIIYWVMRKKITLYTDLGEIEVNKIRAFKRMLKDIDDIKMAEVGDVILWEQFLPYAVVFGVSDKVIKALKLNFSAEQISHSMIVPYYIGTSSLIGSGSGGFQSAFVGAVGAGGVSSISGSSGGFTGGSSGGFGGGSGGGAF